MGDRIIITEEEDKRPDVIVVKPDPVPKTETVVTEKTVITETRKED